MLKSNALWTFFHIQFLGAFNDNIFKNALVILISFESISLWGMASDVLISFAFGLFILPFFIFSAIAGQLADKYNKNQLIIRLKLLEVVIMVLAVLGLYWQNYAMLMLVLFLMGAQSAFFGPIKYSIIPALLVFDKKITQDTHNLDSTIDEQHHIRSKQKKLLFANGLVEMGTFIAILTGTILAGVLVSEAFFIQFFLPTALLLVALSGLFFSFFLPQVKSVELDLKINFSLWGESLNLIKNLKSNVGIYHSILLISLFWFLGACILSQLPVWGRDILGQDQKFVSFMLASFSVGIGVGSLVCRYLIRWLNPSQITTISSVLLMISLLFFVYISYLINIDLTAENTALVYAIFIALFTQGFFAGTYIVPLYTFIQLNAKPSRLARTIAANNILNAMFMVFASLLLIFLLSFGFKLLFIFVFLSVLFSIVFFSIYFLDKNKEQELSFFS